MPDRYKIAATFDNIDHLQKCLVEIIKKPIGFEVFSECDLEISTFQPKHTRLGVWDLGSDTRHPTPKRLGYSAFIGGIAGLTIALGFQWWTMSVTYPMNIGGKPFFDPVLAVPVTFVVTILGAALFTAIGFVLINCRNSKTAARFTGEEFTNMFKSGLPVLCIAAVSEDDCKFISDLLESSGAKELKVIKLLSS